jgi:hypothetical protein
MRLAKLAESKHTDADNRNTEIDDFGEAESNVGNETPYRNTRGGFALHPWHCCPV